MATLFRLPVRYQGTGGSRGESVERIEGLLRPGMRILDVGAGRRPTVAPERRPEGVHYTGVDILGAELDLAGPRAYDDARSFDITEPLPEDLVGQFDLVICVSVLEHVSSLVAAIEGMRDALRPGGAMVFHTAGRWGLLPGVMNRILPRRVGVFLLGRMTRRSPDTVFLARYDRCYDRAIRRILKDDWTAVHVRPLHFGGYYLLSVRPLLWPYLAWEELTRRAGWRDLATHYLVYAERPPFLGSSFAE
jgi:SAM-dependent methyltransferase